MRKKVNYKKIGIVLVVCIILILIVVSVLRSLSECPFTFPDSGLSQTPDFHAYKSFNGLDEKLTVQDIYVDVPSTKKEGSSQNLYELGNNSLLGILELGSMLDPAEKALSVMRLVDTSNKSPRVYKTGEGYLNGYKWTYICAYTKDYALTLYTTPFTSTNDLVIAVVSFKPSDDVIKQGVIVQQGVIGTITFDEVEPVKEGNGKALVPGNPYSEKYDNFQELYDNEISKWKDVELTQQYKKNVLADNNYEHLRLTVNWTNTFTKPREIHCYNSEETLEYAPVEVSDSKYVFIIDNVKYDDLFIVYFDMPAAGEIAFQQEEEADYEEYANRSDEDLMDFSAMFEDTSNTDEGTDEGTVEGDAVNAESN